MATQLQDMKADQAAGENALARRAAHPITGKTDFLDKRKELLGAGIPGHMTVEREIRTATVMLMQSKDLQAATPQSFYVAVSVAINSGIGLGNGKSYLVAYKGNVSFVPGWKGLIDLVNRSGRASAWTGVVHKGDEFEYALGDSPFLKHKPGDNEAHKDITHYYAIGRVKGSDWPHIVVWSVAKVIAHLNEYNKVGGNHYALKNDDNFEAYGRKVVLLQVIKYLPTSQELENAINADNAHAAGKGVTIDANCVFIDDGEEGAPLTPEAEEIPRTDHATEDQATATEKARETAQTVDVREVATEAPTPEAQAAYDGVRAELLNATTLDKLADAADLIQTVSHSVLRKDLSGIYRTAMGEMTDPDAPKKEEAKKEASTKAPAKRVRRSAAAPE